MRRQALATLLFASAAAANLCADQPVPVTANQPWRPAGDRAFVADYPGSGYASLNFKTASEAGCFYRISWLMSSGAKGADQRATLNVSSDNGRFSFDSFPEERKIPFYDYVFSEKGGDLNFTLSIAASQRRVFEAKDVCVVKMKESELFQSNLLLDGDFEGPGDAPASWAKSDPSLKALELRISPNPEFLAGKRCLCIDFKKEANGSIGGVNSLRLPLVPGSEYELKLWAKADKTLMFNAGVQAWSVYGHKGSHFAEKRNFKINEEWRKLSFKFVVPNDLNKYPDLAKDRTAFIYLKDADKEEAKVFIDNVSLTAVQKPR